MAYGSGRGCPMSFQCSVSRAPSLFMCGCQSSMLRQVNGARPMDEVFANINGVLSAFVEDPAMAEVAVA